MMEHCADNKGDRKLGEFWEREFCKMAAAFGFLFTPMQIGRTSSAQAFSKGEQGWNHFTLPDITVWTYPGQHHEIKHKEPTQYGTFGLEKYRLEALLIFANTTGQDVMYTIHNHALSGGRDAMANDMAHWLTANVLDLDKSWTGEYSGYSYVNGTKTKVPIYYWPLDMWMPLLSYWDRGQG